MVPPDSSGVSRAPLYSGYRLSNSSFRVRGSHPLRRAFPGTSTNLRCPNVGPTTPHQQVDVVWALPRSLAATEGVSFDFLSYGYLDVSVPRVCLLHLCIQCKITLRLGFPIRKFTDQSLFAAPRDLSQRITSFIACACQGIHQMPLRHLIVLITIMRRQPCSKPTNRWCSRSVDHQINPANEAQTAI